MNPFITTTHQYPTPDAQVRLPPLLPVASEPSLLSPTPLSATFHIADTSTSPSTGPAHERSTGHDGAGAPYK